MEEQKVEAAASAVVKTEADGNTTPKEDLKEIPAEIKPEPIIAQPLHTAELKPVKDALQQILDDKESELSESERKKLSEALKVVSRDSQFDEVKQTLDALKSDRLDFIEVLV